MATYTVKQGDTLGKLAQLNNTSVGTLASLNKIADPNKINVGQTIELPQIQSIVPAVSVPETIPADQIANTKNFTQTPTEQPQSPEDFVKGYGPTVQSVQDIINQSRQTVAPQEEQVNKVTERVQSVLQRLTGKATRQQELEQGMGVNENVQKLQELNQRIAERSAQFQTEIAGLPGQGRGITSAIVSAQTDRERRLAAVELGGLASVASALQGNITLAREQAERAVNFEFAPQEQEIQNLLFQLEQNKANLTSAQKRQAEDLQVQLSERQAGIDEQKAEKKNILSIAQNAAASGATNQQIQDIINSTSAEDAMAKGGAFLGAEFRAKQQQQSFENNLKLREFAADEKLRSAQLQKIYSEINNRIETGKPLPVENLDLSGATAEVKNRFVLNSILSSSKIGQGTKTNAANSLGVLKALEDLAVKNPDGKFVGVSPVNRLLNIKIPFTNVGLPFREILKKEKSVANQGPVEAIELKVQQWASGASLTEEQTKAVSRLVPKTTDTDKNFKTKMNSLANFMLTQVSAQLQSEGIDFQPEQVNFFETKDLLGKASASQLKELQSLGLTQ